MENTPIVLLQRFLAHKWNPTRPQVSIGLPWGAVRLVSTFSRVGVLTYIRRSARAPPV